MASSSILTRGRQLVIHVIKLRQVVSQKLLAVQRWMVFTEGVCYLLANFVMGHEADDMASHYQERISDDRLRRVSNHVHAWLFNATA